MQQLPLHYPALDIIEYAFVKEEKEWKARYIRFFPFNPFPFPQNPTSIG